MEHWEHRNLVWARTRSGIKHQASGIWHLGRIEKMGVREYEAELLDLPSLFSSHPSSPRDTPSPSRRP